MAVELEDCAENEKIKTGFGRGSVKENRPMPGRTEGGIYISANKCNASVN